MTTSEALRLGGNEAGKLSFQENDVIYIFNDEYYLYTFAFWSFDQNMSRIGNEKPAVG